MEKINLNAIAKAYHENEAKKAKERVADFVENEIIPVLEAAAKAGEYYWKFVIKRKDVSISDVQDEIAKRVQCRFIGYGKSFTVTWQ